MDSSTTMEILSFVVPYFLSLIAFLIFMEQIFYLKKRSTLPGPSLVLPFIGNAISLVRNPTQFWDLQSSFAKSSPLGVSANYIFGKFCWGHSRVACPRTPWNTWTRTLSRRHVREASEDMDEDS